MSASTHRFVESFSGDESAVKTWVTVDELRIVLGAHLNTHRVRILDRDEMETNRFLYEVVGTARDHVAVVDREGSLISIVDRVKLATQIAEDQLAARLG